MSVETYAATHAAFAKAFPLPTWAARLREQGLARFTEQGYPTTKNEDWHFTSAAPIAAASVDVSSVSLIAAVAPGTARAVLSEPRPSPNPRVTTAATGSATIAPR